MSTRLTLSIDAMGGDNAPDMVVEGIGIALERLSNVDFLLFGNKKILVPLLNKKPFVQEACVVRHTEDVVSNHEKAGAESNIDNGIIDPVEIAKQKTE